MISIVGAGPIGSYTAYLLAKKSYEVNVFEEHKEIGKPVHCTGIVTSAIKDIVPIKNECIINQIGKARIFAPNKKFVEINIKEKDIILDRAALDRQFADMAQDAGAKIFLNHSFLDNDENHLIVKDKRNDSIKKIKFDKLIGADGPLSLVAQKNNMFGKRKFWQGVQARVKIKNDNFVEFYPYFGTYAWLVPENEEVARIGLASKKYARVLFNNFIHKFKGIKKENIIEFQGGIIPEYDPWLKTEKGNNIYIVGDAACQVKATTGGGIISGLKAARSLAYSIETKNSYEKVWKKDIGKNLYLNYKARKIMDRFNDGDWNKLIDVVSSNSIKNILGEEKRDNILKIVIKMIAKKPSLLYFAKYILQI